MEQEQGKRYLTVAEIVAAADLTEEDVDVPEWGGPIRVRALSLGQVQDVQQECVRRDKDGQPVAGPDGQPILDERAMTAALLREGVVEPALTGEDADRLRGKSAAALTRVMEAITRVAGGDALADAAARSFRAGGEQ